MSMIGRWIVVLALGLAPAFAQANETVCNDGKDNDADYVTDCADADCVDTPICQPDGEPEGGDARCSDWVDNDRNGVTDCDDVGCVGTLPCLGSWDLEERKAKARPAPAAIPPAPAPVAAAGQPAPAATSTVAAPVDTFVDQDGERNDIVCSDGIDNDNDGKVDCEDPGCRSGRGVSICQPQSDLGMRFSIVGNVAQMYDLEEEQMDTRFTKLQLRSFGPIPKIQDSFYLVSMRAEKTPRLTFAMFQVPLGGGHTLNINSGGGGLSNALVKSSAKRLLIDAAYYLYSAFEQGNGAAIEVGGPLTLFGPGKVRYRAYAAGGSGRYAGNIGGRYFTYDNTNYTYSVGGSLGINILGHLSRWDSPFILYPVATALGVSVGAKYDQRAQERYPAVNASIVLRHGRFIFKAEDYFKRELNFGSTQNAYNLEGGVLLWRKKLMLAGDFGWFTATEYENPPTTLETDIKKIRDENQWRVALHYYFWGNIGMASVLYSDRWQAAQDADEGDDVERTIKAVAQYRF